MIAQELRHAARTLAARPGWTLVALLTLALGIGANGAVLSLAHAVFLEALPYPKAHRIVAVENFRDGEQNPFSYPNYLDLRGALAADREQAVFEYLAVYTQKPFNLSVDGEPIHAAVELVSADYFPMLGSEAARGRVFSTEEDALPRGERVAVVSDGFWRRRLGERDFKEGGFAEQRLHLRINGVPFEVVGVMPAGFHGLTDGAEVWVPSTTAAILLDQGYLDVRLMAWFELAGRLAEGRDVDGASAAVGAVMKRLAEEYPEANRGREARVRTLRQAWFGDLTSRVRILALAAFLVLLLACVNVSSLLWARTLERRREIALRSALGASRRRLVRRLLVESLLLALLGSVSALVLVRWIMDWLLASSPLDLHGYVAGGIGPVVIASTLVLGASTSLLFGLLPALGGTRLDLRRELAEGGGGGGRHSRRLDLLITAEFALAFVLLYGAFFASHRFERLMETDLGYRTDRLVTLRVNPWGEQYATIPSRVGVASRLLNGLREVPEVEGVALVGPYMPGENDWQTRRMTVENWPGDPLDATIYLQAHHVSTGYFEMMEIALLDGRSFQLSDFHDGRLAVIVSESAARRCWPEQNPIGRRLQLGAPDKGGPMMTVVGLVEDLAESGFAHGSEEPHVYFYMPQYPPTMPPTLNILLRTARDPDDAFLATLREAAQAIVPELPIYDVRTLDSRLDEQLAGDRFLVRLMALFTLLALVLAAAGIYGLTISRVLGRIRELGIRLALGSRPVGLFRRTLGQGLVLALLGSLVGAGLTYFAARLLESRAAESFLEPRLFGLVALLLVGLSLAAALWPAWRAARVDPMIILREE